MININVEVGAPNKEDAKAKVCHPNPMSINTYGRLAITPKPLAQMTYIPSYLLLGYAAYCLFCAMSPKRQFKSAVNRMSHLEFVTVVLYLGVYRHFKVAFENGTTVNQVTDVPTENRPTVDWHVRYALEMLESLNIGDWLIPDYLLPWFEAIGKVKIPGTQFELLPTLPPFKRGTTTNPNYGVADADSASFLPNFYQLTCEINKSLVPPHTPPPPTPQFWKFPGLTHTPEKPTSQRMAEVGFCITDDPPETTKNWEEWLYLSPSRFQVWAHGWKAFTDGLSCKKSVSQLGSVGSKASLIRSVICKDAPDVKIDDNWFTPTVKSRDFVEGTDFAAGVTFGPNMRINKYCAYNDNDNHGKLGKTITNKYFIEDYYSDSFENLTQTMHQYVALSET